MSYCRFSDGDVYLYPSTGKGGEPVWCCAMCRLDSTHASLDLKSPEEAWDHLLAHRRAGQIVPDRAFRRLESEMRTSE